MDLLFSKYQGTGNDFIMVNNLDGRYNDLSIEQVQQLCDRRFGIGADGLILLSAKKGYDFEMDYFNADGSKSFCGNGARCSVAFAQEVGIVKDKYHFLGIDGEHEATVSNEHFAIKMRDCELPNKVGNDFYLYTGSPHYMIFDSDLSYQNTFTRGETIRYSDAYNSEGVNVNLIQQIESGKIAISTYERGVEDETLSCGTGATACALLIASLTDENLNEVAVKVKGGQLYIRFEKNENGFKNVWLVGPAQKVFGGTSTI